MTPISEVRYSLPMDLIQHIGAYLAQRPFNEVIDLMRRLELESMKIDVPLPGEPAASEPKGEAP